MWHMRFSAIWIIHRKQTILPKAVVSCSAILGNNVAVGANAVIEDEKLGDDVVVGALRCFIGKNVKIGAGTQLWANVSVYHEVKIGEHCLIQSGAVIGSGRFWLC